MAIADPSPAQSEHRSAGVINDHQTGLAVSLGRVREFLHRYPWAPNVVGAAADVLLAARAHRRGQPVRAMLHAGSAGYNAALAVTKAQAQARRDELEGLGVDPDTSWRGPRRNGELEIDRGPA